MMEKLQVFNPYNDDLIAEYDLDSWDKIDGMLATASKLASSHKHLIPLPERIRILNKTADLVAERLERYALEATEEGGKPLSDSRVELQRAVQGIREAITSLSMLNGREIPMNLNAASANRAAYTFREPIGPVVAISAFNHPFNLIVHQAIPAVAVGCPVIVKPAPATPVSCVNLVECLYEAGLPKEWCQVTHCSNEVAERLVTDPRVAFLTFIGSAKVGWYLRSRLAPGTRCTLEHGGAAPVIVEADADIEAALPLLAKGGFYHAGQVCVSVQRVFVHESIAKKFTDGLVEIAKNLVVGDPRDEKTEVGPLILSREADRVHEWVEEAVQSGAELMVGGEKINASCYAPTVLLNPPDDAKVSQKEIFGPVINIYTYSERDDAIKRANAVPFSFQAAVFSKSLDVVLDTVKSLNAATVMVNDHTAFRVDWMPFYGRKQSGYGTGGILPTMEEMTEEKMVVFKDKVL